MSSAGSRGTPTALQLEPGRSTAGPPAQFLPDHLAWWQPASHPGSWCRIGRCPTGEWELLTGPGIRVAGSTGGEPNWTSVGLPSSAADVLPEVLYQRLKARGRILRIGTPTVWEATATAVIRQVVHRDQARAAFDRLCSRFGVPFMVGGRVHHSIPSPEMVLATTEADLGTLRIGFKARTLRTLAEWCLDAKEHLTADELHDALLGVRGIGPWTAAVAVCDRFSDFSFYPVDDLAVRAHARASWASHPWPTAAKAFAREWRALTAPHTAAITAHVMAEAILSGG